MNGQIIIGIIPLVIELVRMVENVILGKGKGKKKKKAVMGIVREIENALFVGGVLKKKHDPAFIDAIDSIIDKAVEILNEKGIFK